MPIRHTIAPGDTTIGLSEKHGLFAGTIWDDPANAELKQKRKDMNVLMPGDVLVIPDKRIKEVSKASDQKYKFKRKGIPAKFRMQVFECETPRANQQYRLIVDGVRLGGKTDGNGVLETYISPVARHGELIVGPDEFRLEIDFGHLDPIDEISGVQMRLNNLGYGCGEPNGEMNDQLRAALREFQQRFQLPATGELNDQTRKKLEQVHDASSSFPGQS